jgi:hypothetical protein
LVSATLLLLLLAPVAARADTHTFLNLQGYGPGENGGTVGAANNYPGTVAVSGLTGTVTKVTVTVLDLTTHGTELDMALVGPNGANVMLMSDACASPTSREYWTFDDAAAVFVNSGDCGLPGQRSLVKPTNYGDPDLDNLAVNGGPAGPYLNSLSVFNGISPNGDWKLFLLDDTIGEVGFTMSGWALNLEVQPPPPPPPAAAPPAPPPTIVTVTIPGTGKRAAALAKCKKKRTKQQRAACRTKARKLPV